MRKYILAVSLLLVSCAAKEQPSTKQPAQSAGAVLTAYFEALNGSDTTRALRLSTVARQKWLVANAADYWKADTTNVSAEVLEERQDVTIKNRQLVRFVQTTTGQSSGKLVWSDTLDCEMFLEEGEWRVSQCYPPAG